MSQGDRNFAEAIKVIKHCGGQSFTSAFLQNVRASMLVLTSLVSSDILVSKPTDECSYTVP